MRRSGLVIGWARRGRRRLRYEVGFEGSRLRTCDPTLLGCELASVITVSTPTYVPDLVSWCGRRGAMAAGPSADVLGGGLSGRELVRAAFAWSRQ